MRHITIIATFWLLGLTAYSQNHDNLLIQNKIVQLEKDNIELKAKIDAYNENNSKILNTVSISIAILLFIFGLVNVVQLIQNYRLNNKRLEVIKGNLKEELSKNIENIVSMTISNRISEIVFIKQRLLELEISCLQNKCPSTDPQNINIEVFNLISLLNLSFNHYKETQQDYHINTALDGIVKHLEQHGCPDYEKEMIFKSIKDFGKGFEFKTTKILNLLKEE